MAVVLPKELFIRDAGAVSAKPANAWPFQVCPTLPLDETRTCFGVF